MIEKGVWSLKAFSRLASYGPKHKIDYKYWLARGVVPKVSILPIVPVLHNQHRSPSSQLALGHELSAKWILSTMVSSSWPFSPSSISIETFPSPCCWWKDIYKIANQHSRTWFYWRLRTPKHTNDWEHWSKLSLRVFFTISVYLPEHLRCLI